MFHVEQKTSSLEKTQKNHISFSETRPLRICKDHLVSGETFEIKEVHDGILKTFPFPEDLNRYYESEDYISHNDSSKGLQEKIYQLVKSYMLSQKASWIQDHISQGSLLDFGAGTGEFLNQMKNRKWDVLGVEPNLNARTLGIKKNLDIKSELSEIENRVFDVVSLWHVLEHIPDFETKITEIQNLLTENGLLIIAVPNYNSYDANYYKEDWAAWDVPRHLWHFSREGIKTTLENNGFHLLREKPLKFDSYYVSLLSESHRSKSTNIPNAFYRGFLSNLKAKTSGEYSSIAYFFQKVT